MIVDNFIYEQLAVDNFIWIYHLFFVSLWGGFFKKKRILIGLEINIPLGTSSVSFDHRRKQTPACKNGLEVVEKMWKKVYQNEEINEKKLVYSKKILYIYIVKERELNPLKP